MDSPQFQTTKQRNKLNKNVKILDCTLRDGGRVIDCAFPQFHIEGIIDKLTQAGTDIIEIGFLRGKCPQNADSTFFTKMEHAREFVPVQKNNSMYVLFADYGEEYDGWDFNNLPKCDEKTITGIRLGFRKKDFQSARDTIRLIQDKGYKLFLQMIDTTNYSELEFVQTLQTINTIKPYAVGIVDTFGNMYKDDLIKIYKLTDKNIENSITIDFHTHNNMQLSFSLAQDIITMNDEKRKIILDSTLDGMGKGAGNLNTELIANYMNSKYGYCYDFDFICDAVDEHILWIKNNHNWGYSVANLISGIFSAHPNNVTHLLKKNRLKTKDIRHVFSMINPSERLKRYDYDNLDKTYFEYSAVAYDDKKNLKLLTEVFCGKTVLVVVFGKTSKTYRCEILQYIEEYKPIVISVNHTYKEYKPDYVFYGNHRRYKTNKFNKSDVKCIVTSNIPAEDRDESDIVVYYSSLVSVGYQDYDNSTIMLINLLRNVGVERFVFAGFDGYSNDVQNDFSNEILFHNAPQENDDSRNEKTKKLLKNFANFLTEKHSVQFITPSIFETIFQEQS
jgi:4-hydroxy 2-oxovalerate aldolase